jgi:hypothetical protein
LDVIESSAYVKFGEVFGVGELVDNVRDQWQWVLIINGNGIEFSVILYRSEVVGVFLRDKKEW